MPDLTFEQLYDGYSKTLENAERLLHAAMAIWDNYPEIALGLFELGQEEIGKSFTFLATFALVETPEAETFLLRNWRNHRVKAHRAFFYEHFSPIRCIITDPKTGESFEGLSIRRGIHVEKEVSFYVDYDNLPKKFISPRETVRPIEVTNRGGALLCLLMIASAPN